MLGPIQNGGSMEIKGTFSSIAKWFYDLVSSTIPDNKVSETQNPNKSQYLSVHESHFQKIIFRKAAIGSSPKSLPNTFYFSPFSMLFLASCSSAPNQEKNDSWTPSPKDSKPEDSGTSPNLESCDPSGNNFTDRDNDGFCETIDCNDGDPDYIPLKNNETVSIDRSVTLCPGAYSYSKLIIQNSKEAGIEVRADGVSINNGEIILNPAYKVFLTGAELHISGGPAITVTGNFNTLENIALSGDYGTGLVIAGSNNKITNLNSVGLQNPLMIKDGQQNTIQGCSLSSSGIHLNDYVELRGGNGDFLNNVLMGVKLLISGPLYKAQANNISGLDGYGIELKGNSSSIINNLSKNNGYGLYIDVNGCNNTIQGNDFRENSIKSISDVQGCNTIGNNQQ